MLDLESQAHFGCSPHFSSGAECIIQSVKNWLLIHQREKSNQMLKFSKRNSKINTVYWTWKCVFVDCKPSCTFPKLGGQCCRLTNFPTKSDFFPPFCVCVGVKHSTVYKIKVQGKSQKSLGVGFRRHVFVTSWMCGFSEPWFLTLLLWHCSYTRSTSVLPSGLQEVPGCPGVIEGKMGTKEE